MSTVDISKLRTQFVNILTKFCEPRLARLNEIYHWEEPDEVPPSSVHLKFQSDCSTAEWNILLKKALHRAWVKANLNNSERYKIAVWTINTWGGVKRNKADTIDAHIKMTYPHKRIATPWKGVASYSKLLAIAHPETYVIFDARVAASLNAIQILACKKLLIRFPIPAGQNAAIKRFAQHIHKYVPLIVVKPRDVYQTYLESVHSASAKLGAVDIWLIEMLLFGLATRLARQIVPPPADGPTISE